MSRAALYVTLRVPDPSALTAHRALQALSAEAPRALERGRIWYLEGGGEVLENRSGVWFNPNKESGVPWVAGPCPWDGPAEGECWWVVVRDRLSRPEGEVLRSLGEQGLPAPADLITASLWQLCFDPARGPAQAACEDAAVVRSPHHGLLVNPHSQVHRVCRPPGAVAELGRLLTELRREAA